MSLSWCWLIWLNSINLKGLPQKVIIMSSIKIRKKEGAFHFEAAALKVWNRCLLNQTKKNQWFSLDFRKTKRQKYKVICRVCFALNNMEENFVLTALPSFFFYLICLLHTAWINCLLYWICQNTFMSSVFYIIFLGWIMMKILFFSGETDKTRQEKYMRKGCIL